MPSVAFYNSQVLPDDAIFESPEYEESYGMFARVFSEKGGTMYIVRGLKHYSGENAFDGGWKYSDGKWERTEEPFSVDIIFNRGFDLPLDQPLYVMNNPELSRRCLKAETAKLFPEDCPATFQADSVADLPALLAKIKTDNVVIKPLDSYGGNGVIIGPTKEAAEHIEEFPVLLQEFIDTSKGIPGLAEAHHDLRLTFVGDSLTDCYLRQPAPGKLLSNVAQGGSIRQIPLDQIPQGARALAFKVDKVMSEFPDRIYCVDMGLHDLTDWKIIELNAPPGMPIIKEDSDIRSHMEFLADHFLKIAHTAAE